MVCSVRLVYLVFFRVFFTVVTSSIVVANYCSCLINDLLCVEDDAELHSLDQHADFTDLLLPLTN